MSASSSSLSTSVVMPHAMKLPIFDHLQGKRVILASSSPRRKELLGIVGINTEIVPSTFKEDLPKSAYEHALAEYPSATAGEKALEVYERLVAANPDTAPDLVISADTVIIFPPQTSPYSAQAASTSSYESEPSYILEKPEDKEDQRRMLLDMNGRKCEVVTGVVVVHPTLAYPGYKLSSISVSTLVEFEDNPVEMIDAYVENGEGLDRAGGFAIQGLGSLLVKKIEGDYSNVVGFPIAAFWKWMSERLEEGDLDD